MRWCRIAVVGSTSTMMACSSDAFPSDVHHPLRFAAEHRRRALYAGRELSMPAGWNAPWKAAKIGKIAA
jgi:hypothetical protein